MKTGNLDDGCSMLDARAARKTSSVAVDLVLWISVALNVVRDGGNEISIGDQVAVTDTSMYRRVGVLYFWESVQRRRT